jgi:pimeloyl-ACP methyl ester carboxylesterase
MKLFNLINAVLAVSFSIINTPRTYAQTLFAASADSIRIAYEVHGTGTPALIFVHGWSCDRSYWQGQIEPFSRDFKVVAIDLAGHGESGLGRRSWTIEAFGADVAAVVKKLNLQRVILIGHSMGSNVIAEAARQMPGRVAGLVLVDQYKDLGPGLSQEEVQAFAAKLRTNFSDPVAAFVRKMFVSTSDSALVERVAADMASAPAAIALDALVFTLNYSRQMPHTLEELKLPVIAINDAGDRPMPPH